MRKNCAQGFANVPRSGCEKTVPDFQDKGHSFSRILTIVRLSFLNFLGRFSSLKIVSPLCFGAKTRAGWLNEMHTL